MIFSAILQGTPGEPGMMKAEEKRNMRKYGKDGRLESMICNRCGRKLAVRNGIVREGVFSSDHAWDFFSEKDGEVHHFDLCEECYDEVTGEFRVAVEVEEEIEML